MRSLPRKPGGETVAEEVKAWLEGRARIVDDVDVKKLIREKYGWQMRLLERFGGGGASVVFEVQDSPVSDTAPGG